MSEDIGDTTTGEPGTQSGRSPLNPEEITVIIVRHPDLCSRDPRVWKPMYKRLKNIAKLKGHPLSCGLPALGYAYFDGKMFRNEAFVAFEFADPTEHNRFVDRIRAIPNATIRATGKPWWNEELFK